MSGIETVRPAILCDLKYVVHLSKLENHALGFIPKMAYEAAITGVKKGKRWSDKCNDKLFVISNNGDLVGFCLASFGIPTARFRRGKIAQICIQEDARKISRGKKLLEAVVSHGATVGCWNFGCGCADDLPSNFFWRAMGWDLVSSRFGISHTNTWRQTSNRLVNIYHYDDPRQLKLWSNQE